MLQLPGMIRGIYDSGDLQGVSIVPAHVGSYVWRVVVPQHRISSDPARDRITIDLEIVATPPVFQEYDVATYHSRVV